MSKLTKDWLTENYIDFELKQYVLLAYLQEVKQNYQSTKIYPYLADLIEHYKNLFILKKNQDEIKEYQTKELRSFDFKTGKLIYKLSEKDNEIFETLNQIIDYAMPLIAQNIQDGKQIYDFVEEHVTMKSVGICPLRKEEGYLLLHCADEEDVYAYQYHFSLFNSNQQHYRAIHVKKIEHYKSRFCSSFENIKMDLLEKHNELPNPAVFALNCSMNVPLEETFLPIAKRYFATRYCA